MRLRRYLNEEWFVTGKTNIWGLNNWKPIEIFVNPSKSELKKIGRSVRFTADDKTKKVYAWNGEIGLHDGVWNNILKKELGDSRKYDHKTFLRGAYEKGEFKPDPKWADDCHDDLDLHFRGENCIDWRWVDKYIHGVADFYEYVSDHSHR